MTENEMRKFVECDIVAEHEYELFKSIAKDLDFASISARRFACLTLYYRLGRISEKEYKTNDLFKQAKKDGWI